MFVSACLCVCVCGGGGVGIMHILNREEEEKRLYRQFTQTVGARIDSAGSAVLHFFLIAFTVSD